MQRKPEQSDEIERNKTMQRKPEQADHRQATSVEADEATIALAFEQQLAQAESTPALAATLRHAPPTLYGRFASAYRDLLALSRARRRKLLRSLGMSLAAAALAFALALGGVPTAHAASITVGGSCTLVDAITAANTDTATGGCAAGSGADTITLPANGTITLTSVNNYNSYTGNNGLPRITSVITIAGNGTTITRDSSAPNFRIMLVANSGNLTLNDTTISGGTGNYSGAGIFNYDTLTLNNSTISGNSNTGANVGAGIANVIGAMLTLTNSTVSGNTAGNMGGGIFNQGAATLTNSTVSGNTATYEGGGISTFGYPFTSGVATTLSNSTVSGNSAGHNGGGTFNNAFATLTLERSLVSGNTASSGNETFTTTTIHCTPSYYGPICNTYTGTVNSANFNVFGHSGESNAQAFTIFTPSGSDISATSDGTDPTALAGILGPLANNGGATQTRALVPCSPAIDAAPSGLATDQRGVSRPQGAAFDSGAFELEAPTCNTAPVATNDSYSTNEDTVLSVAAPGVLGNDTDADSNPLTAVLVSGPTHGTLTLNANGSFSYTPAANFSGSDSFSYKANDGTADSNVATVSLTVRSALDQIDDLIAAVQALADSGTINGGQNNALITKLENAQAYVTSGQTSQAISKMRAFINQVNSFIGGGVLTSAEGQPLIDKANAIIHSLGG